MLKNDSGFIQDLGFAEKMRQKDQGARRLIMLFKKIFSVMENSIRLLEGVERVEEGLRTWIWAGGVAHQ
jgi:hypothetical protein